MSGGDWIILRVAGRQTMRLAESLKEDGFDCWTPIETKRIHIPRMNVRREVRLPLMASYVFARATHLADLLRIIDAKKRMASPHVEFSLMRGAEHGIVGVADRHLQELRTLEQKKTPRRRAARLPQGMSIKVKQEGGNFAGMSGKVIRSGEHQTLVILDSRMKVELPTFMFDEIDIRTGQVVLPKAA